uniref:Cadherin domain-containing protein n=1 Tax=Plectus sambesii TaxID=2011161 RepID=A0A914VYU9_9BILA
MITPVINLKGAEKLLGTVREDQRVVTVSPEISLLEDTGPVCSYELTPEAAATDGDSVPFAVDVTDKQTGAAVVRVKDGSSLDCAVAVYRLRLKAVRCDDADAKSEGFVRFLFLSLFITLFFLFHMSLM